MVRGFFYGIFFFNTLVSIYLKMCGVGYSNRIRYIWANK